MGRSSALCQSLYEYAELLQAGVGADTHADDTQAKTIAACKPPQHINCHTTNLLNYSILSF